MHPDDTESFEKERERLNEIVSRYAGPTMRKFYGLDAQAYADGAVPARTKELLGLVASLVLRCDDCIRYHLIRCRQEGVSDAELAESLSIGVIVGGSITIPHLRRAFAWWEELRGKDKDTGDGGEKKE